MSANRRRPPPREVRVPEMRDSWGYTRDLILKGAALLIFLCAAGYHYVRGFIEGVLESRETYLLAKEESAKGETPFPDRPRPAARPRPRPVSATETPYEVLCGADSEVTVNGIPIGHIDASPWQFCSYDIDYGNGPARESKARAFDDACDYAETVFSYSRKN